MLQTETEDEQPAAEQKRLMIGNIPFEVEKPEFVQQIARFGKVDDAFLSAAKAAQHKNAGWGIIVVSEPVARRLLAETIMVRDRVVRVSHARPKA